MLAGIKFGKKKKKRTAEDTGPSFPPSSSTAVASSSSADQNAEIAALLRQNLASGTTTTPTAAGPSHPQTSDSIAHTTNKELLLGEAVPLGKKPEHEWSIAEMAAAEKLYSHNKDEANILRHFKHKRRKTYVDSDDEEADQINVALGNYSKNEKHAQRESSRKQHMALTQNKQMQAALSKSWWWLESDRFEQQRLLAKGKYVSLVWAPPFGRLSRKNKLGIPQHMYLVPIQPATSFRVCEEETVWKELRQFQSTLRKMYASMKLDVVFAEIVLENSSSYWQTKMQVLAFPQRYSAEVPMYVRQAFAEQDYEPHKLIKTTPQKGLTRSVPLNFPYAFLQSTAGEGYAQVLEASPTRKFPLNFWIDMIGGMMGMDGFYKQKTSNHEERDQIKAFQKIWPDYDFL